MVATFQFTGWYKVKLTATLIALLALAACSSPNANTPANICILAACEQEATTGDGDLEEGDLDANAEVGL